LPQLDCVLMPVEQDPRVGICQHQSVITTRADDLWPLVNEEFGRDHRHVIRPEDDPDSSIGGYSMAQPVQRDVDASYYVTLNVYHARRTQPV
jgi:hypothetical protein